MSQPMNPDQQYFIEALTSYVAHALAQADEAPEYNRDAVEILDARNHLFRPAGKRRTDEEQNIYALTDLCRMNEDLDFVPDAGRIRSVSRNFFSDL